MMKFLLKLTVTVLFFGFVYGLDTILNIDEINSYHYSIDIQGVPVRKEETPAENVMRVVNKFGQEYTCKLPVINLSEEEPIGNNTEEKENIDIRSILDFMDDAPCFQKQLHWWTYEFCYGSDVKQYHVEDEKVIGPIIILGKYESEYDWSNNSEAKNKLQKYHTQYYVNGTRCDVNGEPRRTEVRFQCDEGSPISIQHIDEPESCHYVLTIGADKLCKHPYLRSQMSSKPKGIICAPSLSAQQMDKYVEIQEEQPSQSPISEASLYPELQEAHETLEDDSKKSPPKFFMMDEEIMELDRSLNYNFAESLFELKKAVYDETMKPGAVSSQVQYLTSGRLIISKFLRELWELPMEEKKSQTKHILIFNDMVISIIKTTLDIIDQRETLLNELQNKVTSYNENVLKANDESTPRDPEVLEKMNQLLSHLQSVLQKQIQTYVDVRKELEELQPVYESQVKSLQKLFDTMFMSEEMEKEFAKKLRTEMEEQKVEKDEKTEVVVEETVVKENSVKTSLEKKINQRLKKSGYEGQKIQIKIVTPEYMTENTDAQLVKLLKADDVVDSILQDLIQGKAGYKKEQDRFVQQLENYNFNFNDLVINDNTEDENE